jgi:rsbT co-antagonist protein RsbR
LAGALFTIRSASPSPARWLAAEFHLLESAAMGKETKVISTLIEKHSEKLLSNWISLQLADGAARGKISEADLTEQSRRLLAELRKGAQSGSFTDLSGPEWIGTREILDEVSRNRATLGFSPSATATFVFSLKEPLFNLLRAEVGKDAEKLATEIWAATQLLDRLGLYTTEVFQKTREQVINQQKLDLLELSTPVVELWEGILALPLIGTLDSARTQVVMENLLERIVTLGAEIAIIDITGVPTVDTLVAQHLIKTVSAARLMGADCLISGIRPQIAQTIVHLGIELDLVSKATMADAFALALRRTGKAVTSRSEARPERE